MSSYLMISSILSKMPSTLHNAVFLNSLLLDSVQACRIWKIVKRNKRFPRFVSVFQNSSSESVSIDSAENT
jgi:transposase